MGRVYLAERKIEDVSRVFIYGGCTSRDAVDHYPDYGLEMHSYIARQSLISAFSPISSKLFDYNQIQSTFQKRMIRWDVAGHLPAHLRASAQDIDLIIWDLMIERVGVRPVVTGGYVTNNPQTRKYTSSKRLGESIRFGTEEHIGLWQQALEKFTLLLKETELYDKTIVNATPWALSDRDGARADYPDAGMSAEWFNETIQPYWELIEAAGMTVARVDPKYAVSDPDHKWGPANFHYVPSTYTAQLDLITALRGSPAE